MLSGVERPIAVETVHIATMRVIVAMCTGRLETTVLLGLCAGGMIGRRLSPNERTGIVGLDAMLCHASHVLILVSGLKK